MHYHYIAFGLTIESALELPELGLPAKFAGEPDLTIRLGKVSPFATPDSGGRNRAEWRDDQHFLFRSENGTHFAVNDGREIVVMLEPGADPVTVRLLLLGSMSGAMLLQRGFLVLHGNAIRVGEGCLVCIGDTGAGKSTLAAAFLKRGFDVLADDVVAVDRSGCAVPSFPRMKLWQDAADQLGICTKDLVRVMPDLDKYNLPLADHDPSLRMPIRWVYELTSADVDDVHIERIVGVNRFNLLRHNTYRRGYLHGAMLARHLEQCSRLAGRVRLAKVVRPSRRFSLDLLVDRVLDDIAANRAAADG